MSGSGRVLAIANRHPRLQVDRAALERAVDRLDAQGARFLGGCPPGGRCGGRRPAPFA